MPKIIIGNINHGEHKGIHKGFHKEEKLCDHCA
jgi:hypothetical protein